MSGNLMRWVKQKVLLLNTTLTVRKGEAASHRWLAGGAWAWLTELLLLRMIKHWEEANPGKGIVFLLWGTDAKNVVHQKIDGERHHQLVTSHPSPFSVNNGFSGSRCFANCNRILLSQGSTPIRW